MAKETELELWIGEDKQFLFTVYNADETAVLDFSTWGLDWMVKRRRTDADASAVIRKYTGGFGIAIGGTFNAIPTTNTLVATCTVADIDSDAIPAGIYYHELKRTDADAEAPLSYGPIRLRQSVHRT